MDPQISVVIPCYNQAHLLGEALESVRRQEITDWEVVVVDDCSTQGDVCAVVDAFADRRVRVLRHPLNRGLAAARNTGVIEARSDLIMPLDADDCLAPSFLGKVLACFANPEVDYIWSNLKLFGSGTGVWRFDPFEPAEMGLRQAVPACAAFRRRTWKAVGGYCEEPEIRIGNEDWDFWMGVVSRGFRGTHLAEPLFEYRQMNGSLSCTQKPMLYQTHEFMAVRHRRFLEQHGVLDAFLRVGYEGSALAEASQGGYLEGVRLACQAVKLGSENPLIIEWASYDGLPAYVMRPYFRFRLLCAALRSRLLNCARSLSRPVKVLWKVNHSKANADG